MTAQHDDLTIRPITGPGELDLFNRLPYRLNEELAADLDKGHRRPEWLWLALRDGRLAARAGWWARPGDEHPLILDILDLDDSGRPETVDIAARLLRTAMAGAVPEGTRPPQYLRFLDPDWRESPATRQATEDRMAAAAQTGARFFVERLNLEWRPGTPIPTHTAAGGRGSPPSFPITPDTRTSLQPTRRSNLKAHCPGTQLRGSQRGA